MSVPVMSIGIRSGVNWMRLKRERHRLGDLADQKGLGQTGDAHQQAVAACEQADGQLFDHGMLADDHAAQFLSQPAVDFAQAVDRRHVAIAERVAMGQHAISTGRSVSVFAGQCRWGRSSRRKPFHAEGLSLLGSAAEHRLGEGETRRARFGPRVSAYQ